LLLRPALRAGHFLQVQSHRIPNRFHIAKPPGEVTISQRYIHLSAERVADAVKRLESYNATRAKELSEGVVLQ